MDCLGLWLVLGGNIARIRCIPRPHFCGQHFDDHTSLIHCMPTRAIIMSSEDDGDGGDADWISAKDSKETRDSRHASALCRVVLLRLLCNTRGCSQLVRKRSADGIVPETPVEKVRS